MASNTEKKPQNQKKTTIPPEVKRTVKKTVDKSVKRHPWIWLIVILVIIAAVFILTPTENPLKTKNIVFDSVSEELAIPAYSPDDIVVRHTGFTLSYNEKHEQPNWVAYLLTSDKVFGNASSRGDNFREDPSIPTGSSTLADYRGSGYDRGHLIPAADQKWSSQAMDDCFYLSNMSPQTHAFNAGIWSKLESAVRTMAAQNKEICVATGPILTNGPFDIIGPNAVSVPKHFYKVILDYYGPDKKAIGFILAQDSKGELKTFAVSVNDVEKFSGIDFFPSLPDDEEEALESQYDVTLWDLSDFNRTATAKKYGYDLDNPSSTPEPQTVTEEPQDPWESVLYFLYTNFGQYKKDALDLLHIETAKETK